MQIQFIDLHAQYLSIKSDIDNAIQDIITNTAFIGGKPVTDFAHNFEQLYGAKHCVPVANGTDAIYITLKMLGIGIGDEVITTACSWISTSETITQAGAKPVFVDIDPTYFTIDADKIEAKITSKTKAIIPVHIYGQICDMDKIMAIAKKHNLIVIEDCAQSHFSEFKGKRAGLTGIAGTFSFFPGKNLGAYGDAGCILTNDSGLAEKCKMYANHGALIKHQHQIEGINSRLDSMQAAILYVKLPHILRWTDLRIQHAASYTKALKGVGDIVTPLVRPDSKHSFHLYVIRTKKRNELEKHLNEHGIATAIHYPTPLPFLPAYSYLKHQRSEFPMAAQAQGEILSIPMYPELTPEQIDYIVVTIKAFF